MVDEFELEEKYHDPSSFVSVSAIDHELKYVSMLIQKYRNSPDEKDFFEFRKDSLKFTMDTIKSNIETGVISE